MNPKFKKIAFKIFIPTIILSLAVCITLRKIKRDKNKSKHGVFYAITGNGLKDTSYLFGTYHLVKSGYLLEIPKVEKAFLNSESLIVEIVIDSAKLPQMLAMGRLKNKTLSSMLNQPFSDSLEVELKQNLGLGMEQFNHLKPINVTITLSTFYLLKNNKEKFNKYRGKPLDIYFTDFAKKNNKNVIALEKPEEQMNLLFNSTSDSEQVKGLRLFLENKYKMIALGNNLMQSWFDNDLDQLNDLYNKIIAVSGEPDYLIKSRNLKWMTALPGLLENKKQFIAVGALHLVGTYGLIERLRCEGFSVTPLEL